MGLSLEMLLSLTELFNEVTAFSVFIYLERVNFSFEKFLESFYNPKDEKFVNIA